MTDTITVTLGPVDERFDVQALPTRHAHIWITPNLDPSRAGVWVLTHKGTGFFLIGPYATLTAVREAADRLVDIIAIREPWTKELLKQRLRSLPPSDREWLQIQGAFD